MSKLISDEFGLSFQLNEDDQSLKGLDCIYANINTISSISSFISTSLGPTGLDKILINKDDGMTVTNDGATILSEMELTSNPISALAVQLSQSQDYEIGDGTTSVIVLASAILESTKSLLESGIHPIKISEGFDIALKLILNELEKVSEPSKANENGIINRELLIDAAKTSLGSKIVSMADLSGICVDAILTIYKNNQSMLEMSKNAEDNQISLHTKNIDLELINIKTKIGKDLKGTELINGIVLEKEFSHPQMRTEIKNAKIALLCCPFEPPRLKNKNKVLIKNVLEFKKLDKYEKEKFAEMIQSIKNSGADLVMCQWGFDDEANSMLFENDLPAIRWVGGYDLGHIATHIKGSLISRFEDLREGDLGIANVKQNSLGTSNDKMIVIDTDAVKSKNEFYQKSVTILVRGSTEYVIKEAERSIRDALCAVRNILETDRIVYGGGSIEMHLSVFLDTIINADYMPSLQIIDSYPPEVKACIRAFSAALLEIPLSLAKNSGFEPLSYVENLRKLHISNANNISIGVDCLETGEKDMKKCRIFESLKSKSRQLQMATNLVNTILKINDVIKLD